MIFFKIHKLLPKCKYFFKFYIIFVNLLMILFCGKSIIPIFVPLIRLKYSEKDIFNRVTKVVIDLQ